MLRRVALVIAFTAGGAACAPPIATCTAPGLRVTWREHRVDVVHGPKIASIYVIRGDRLFVMHASAALGTAIYDRHGDRWQLVGGFTFACRNDGAACLDAFARREGWSANVAEAGGDRRFEVAGSLAAPGAPFTVVSMDPFAAPSARQVSACAGTGGDILDPSLQAGDPPAELVFDPSGWPRVPELRRPFY